MSSVFFIKAQTMDRKLDPGVRSLESKWRIVDSFSSEVPLTRKPEEMAALYPQKLAAWRVGAPD